MTSSFQLADPAEMALDSIGRQLLEALVEQLKVAPETWAKMTQIQQDQTIDRLRERVLNVVENALSMLFSGHYPSCTAQLVSLTVKDEIRASLTVAKSMQNLHELADAVGRSVLVVVASPEDFTARMEEIRARASQGDLFHREPPHDEAPSGDLGEGDEGVDSATVDLSTGEILSRERAPWPSPTLQDSPPATG